MIWTTGFCSRAVGISHDKSAAGASSRNAFLISAKRQDCLKVNVILALHLGSPQKQQAATSTRWSIAGGPADVASWTRGSPVALRRRLSAALL